MYYPDLHTECDIDSGPDTRAIGWLHPGHPFPAEPSAPLFLRCLARHVETAWFPAASVGPSSCRFCGQSLRRANRAASEALWIPTREAVYVAPAAILHYASEHSYAPPEEFVLAVLACPPQGSRSYLTLLRQLPTWWGLMVGDHSVDEVREQAMARRR
ncbi:MAG: hypothetical protein ABJC74_16315 [Gemmatimonadota bacterium]